MAVNSSSSSKRVKLDATETRPLHLVAPGDVITTDTGFMRGHGTYAVEGKLLATVAGMVERVNKLICVVPLKSRYNGEVGDVVVGRIVEVQQKRWKVDTFSRLDSVLLLSSINLPGGALRRRSTQDELTMRNYFVEGDLISAEVQQVFHDGSLSLHTRSLKYGKLGQGTLVAVRPSLVKRCKNHFHNLLCGASIILGNNGYIWICPTETAAPSQGQRTSQPQQQQQQVNVKADASASTPFGRGAASGSLLGSETERAVSREERETIARLRNCCLALAKQKIMLFDTTVLYTYEASLKHEVKDLLTPSVLEEITEPARVVQVN